jgi:hypothetical protein
MCPSVAETEHCINNPKNPDAAKEIIGKVSDILWGEKIGDVFHVIAKGVIVRPALENIRVKAYRRTYDELFEHINNLLAAQ